MQGALEDLRYALEQADARLTDEIKRDMAAVEKERGERSERRRAEKEAKKAKAAVKEYKRQGVVIEELSDEEEEGGEGEWWIAVPESRCMASFTKDWVPAAGTTD
jgi:hypothetical protein